MIPENRIALIHRVLVPDEKFPKEYAILLTDKRSIFIRQEKTRSSFVLRGEMRYGTALVTDVIPKTLEDYKETSLESLAADPANLTILHDTVRSLALKKEMPKFRYRDFFVWLTMRRQGEIFQVYHFQMAFQESPGKQAQIHFYLVPLGAYFKPRRQTKSREIILLEYAQETLQLYRQLLPAGIVYSQPQNSER
jgi:hypothetical protein